MPDFKKHTKQRATESLTDPVEIYERLDRRSDTGPLRPAQEHVLTEWHTHRRDDSDVIVKLHTGQGKTVVGLLMLLSRLNEGFGPALYLCPNKYLVDQTCQQARRFGIAVANGNVEEDLPAGFLSGKQIYVCTVQKLFNGLSKFGLKAAAIHMGTVLMDDSHACIDSIKDSCSISLKSDMQAYHDLLQLFADDLREQGAGTFTDIRAGAYDAVLPVPYWAWIDRRDEVTGIIGKHNKDQALKFVWPILKDILDKCFCVVSGSGLEIMPHVPPLDQFGSFSRAKRRIFMSATVTDDSFLVKGLRLSATTITKPITYPKERWFGEKMILIPTLIAPDTGREEIANAFGKPSEARTVGVVVLCPSTKAAELWRQVGAEIAEAGNIVSQVQRLLDGEVKKTVCIVNRYDGIDLPDQSCRVLILDSKPFSGGLVDRYTESCRPSSQVTAQRTARMIEQGIGRGVRGEKDYCAVILVGGDLVRAVQRSDVKKFYSSQTRRQIEIGIEIAGMSEEEVQHGVSGIAVVVDSVKKILQRDDGWKEFYADRMADVGADTPNEAMLRLYATELKAEGNAEEGRYLDARASIQEMLDTTAGISKEDRGWYTQEMARLLYRHSKAESAVFQASAHKLNGYLLKPKQGMVFQKLEPLSQKRVATIIEWVMQSKDHQDLMVRVQALLDDLRFGVNSDTFEQAFHELGQALGFAAERPDKVWGKGPDNLWCLQAGRYLLVECKNEVKTGRDEIAKTEMGQMNNAHGWFAENYPGAKVECVMVIPTKKVSEAAGFNMRVMVIRENRLKKLTRAVQAFFKEFTGADLKDLDPAAVQKWLNHHNLGTDAIVASYTESVES
jgi:replicative superfamily II helicase